VPVRRPVVHRPVLDRPRPILLVEHPQHCLRPQLVHLRTHRLLVRRPVERPRAVTRSRPYPLFLLVAPRRVLILR
jgi:hypothetical protein